MSADALEWSSLSVIFFGGNPPAVDGHRVSDQKNQIALEKFFTLESLESSADFIFSGELTLVWDFSKKYASAQFKDCMNNKVCSASSM